MDEYQSLYETSYIPSIPWELFCYLELYVAFCLCCNKVEPCGPGILPKSLGCLLAFLSYLSHSGLCNGGSVRELLFQFGFSEIVHFYLDHYSLL